MLLQMHKLMSLNAGMTCKDVLYNTTTVFWSSIRLDGTDFDVLVTAHLSIILAINQLHAKKSSFIISLLYASTFFKHYVLIIRRSKLYYTASGIITPCRWPSGAQVESGLVSSQKNSLVKTVSNIAKN